VNESTVENQQQTHSPDVQIARVAEREWGVLTVAELRACGLSDHGIAARARRGRLHKVHRGVYAVGHTGLTMRGRFLAAVKACGEGAVLSHFSAAALWELVAYDPERRPDVIARHAKRIPGVNAHQTRNPPQAIRYDRIPVTTPARTLADLSSVLPFKPHRRAVREALTRHRITPHEAATLLPTAPPVPTRSDLEDLVFDLIQQAGFETPDVNKPLPNGYIPDFRWRAHRLILEAGGQTWHDDPISRHNDAQRQAELEQDGERILRVTYDQVTSHPHQTVERLRQAGLRGSPGTDPAPTASPARGSPPTPGA
jgi:very-short-patch-repair endonuclease